MAAVEETAGPVNPLRGEAPPSPAGPAGDADGLVPAPVLAGSSVGQSRGLIFNHFDFIERARAKYGDVFRINVLRRDFRMHVTSHPDSAKALFLAKPDEAPSATGDSPLRPVVGPNTVLTAIGSRHLRQRKLLLPSFHGDAVDAYVASIERTVSAEIDRWRTGDTIELAPRMSDVTLDVIMAGVFGAEPPLEAGTPEAELRRLVRKSLALTTKPWWPLAEAPSLGHDSPRWPVRGQVQPVYDALDTLIRARRAVPEAERGEDILSILLAARDEDGVALTDEEIRMELLTLVLAGHETTANSLAWAMERLTREPVAYSNLREAVRVGGPEADAYVDATIHEAMRLRPVVPMIGRRIQSDWSFGDKRVPAGSLVTVSIVLMHRREDLYPRPHDFLPERFIDAPPGTYEWMPFGGGIRRCLGATLAMAEMRVVLRELTRRVDASADRPQPERERMRNVTLIPARGGRVRVDRIVS
ncbi:MAG: cytochrome P450 [Baekduia sp.]